MIMDLIDMRFGAFVAVSALLIVTPGPDIALVTRNALRSGWRAASLTGFGIGAGSLVWTLASMVEVGILLEQSAVTFTLLKLAGAAYLILLGLRSLIASLGPGERPETAVPAVPAQRPNSRAPFVQGVLNNLLNPKAGVIFVSILPQFLRPGDSPVRLVLMLLAYEAMLLIWLNAYGYLIARAGQSRVGVRVGRAVERVTGVVLIGLGARLAFERR